MLRFLTVVAFSVLPGWLLVSRAEAAPKPAPSCSPTDLGVHGAAELQVFDRSLRIALKDQNAPALAKLAHFPLRVTYPEGQHVVVRNALALRNELDAPALRALERFFEAPSVRKFSCNGHELRYADGRIIAGPVGVGTARTLRITAINFQKSSPFWISTKIPSPDLTCQTKTQRYVIQRLKYRNSYRFRVWNLPVESEAKPFLDTTLGGSHVRTTGHMARRCGHFIRRWGFHGNGTWYSVSLPDCYARGSVPENALASVSVGNRQSPPQWCYPVPVMSKGARDASVIRSSKAP